MLPIIAGSCLHVKTSGSSAQRDILENVLCSEEKIVRFKRKDSKSVLGANWAFPNMGHQHPPHQKYLR